MSKSEISAELFRDNLFKLVLKGANTAEIHTYIGAYCPYLNPGWKIHCEQCRAQIPDLKAKYNLD